MLRSFFYLTRKVNSRISIYLRLLNDSNLARFHQAPVSKYASIRIDERRRICKRSSKMIKLTSSYKEENTLLSEQIKRLRKQKKMSQRELGIHFGVIKQTVSSWERGNSNPSHDTLVNMADFFGVSLGEMYGITDPVTPFEEEWPELIQVLRESGTLATAEERKKYAKVLRTLLEG